MKLIITRHAQTYGNVERKMNGPNDQVTPLGIRQAKLLAERLKKEKIDAIYASPFDRTKLTAGIISEYHPDAPINYERDLRERDIYNYVGQGYDKVDWSNIPDDMESDQSMYRRSGAVFKKVYSKHKDDTVLFVAHHALNKCLIRFLKGLPADDKTKIKQENTNVTIFEITDKGRKKVLMNCIKHLL